jgi:hypothetical protein
VKALCTASISRSTSASIRCSRVRYSAFLRRRGVRTVGFLPAGGPASGVISEWISPVPESGLSDYVPFTDNPTLFAEQMAPVFQHPGAASTHKAALRSTLRPRCPGRGAPGAKEERHLGDVARDYESGNLMADPGPRMASFRGPGWPCDDRGMWNDPAAPAGFVARPRRVSPCVI